MASWYPQIKQFHIFIVIVSVSLFLLRFYWLTTASGLLQQRWVRIVPHLCDTFLLLSGALLVIITHFYPFTPQGSWLTEKLLAVIIYVALGFVALSRRPRKLSTRWFACLLALVALLFAGKLAMTKLPILGIV